MANTGVKLRVTELKTTKHFEVSADGVNDPWSLIGFSGPYVADLMLKISKRLHLEVFANQSSLLLPEPAFGFGFKLEVVRHSDELSLLHATFNLIEFEPGLFDLTAVRCLLRCLAQAYGTRLPVQLVAAA